MESNIEEDDITALTEFLSQRPIPHLTNGSKVAEFEKAWSEWLGVKHSVFVNSGSAANQITMLVLKYLSGAGEVIVPPLTWVSDIASVMQAGHTPVFCDINLKNLSFDIDFLKSKITENTKAIFVTHVLGLNGMTDELIELAATHNIPIIEDVCESHGATFKQTKLGTFGAVSNFSFYFAHHMSTIEGGMVCTNNDAFYQLLRCFRSHGMLRESSDDNFKKITIEAYPDLNKDFIFLAPAYNFRSTEINAVLGLSQLKKLDANNVKRTDNFDYFVKNLDPKKYITEFEMEGQCNYAFIVILRRPSLVSQRKVELELAEKLIEFRRGLSGGGNQMRQPYLSHLEFNPLLFPNIEWVHHFGWYIGNYPTLEKAKLDNLLNVLNSLDV